MSKEKTTYGIAYLAEQTGMAGASIRAKLRNLGIEKPGRSYEWTKKSDANDVAKQLKASAPKTEKPAKASKPAKTEKAKKESTAKGKGGKKTKASKGKVDKAA